MTSVKPYDVPRQVTILVMPESSMMCVASVLEPIRAANRVAGKQLYEWEICSLSGQTIELTCGVPLSVDRQFSDRQRGELLVVIAGFNQMKHASSAAIAKVRKAASGFSVIAGVEAGTWVMARAGLLDGRMATTHWEDFEEFSESFPDVDAHLDRYFVDENRMTCGGASPAFDMFLDMIRNLDGAAIAMEVASVFVYDEAHSKFDTQPLVSLGKIAMREPRLEQAVRSMEECIEQPIPIAVLARRVGVSSKTFEELFKRHIGITPGRFYLDLRLKVAKRLVLDSNLSMREIAIRSGFNSLSAFSRAYANSFGKSARDMRAG